MAFNLSSWLIQSFRKLEYYEISLSLQFVMPHCIYNIVTVDRLWTSSLYFLSASKEYNCSLRDVSAISFNLFVDLARCLRKTVNEATFTDKGCAMKRANQLYLLPFELEIETLALALLSSVSCCQFQVQQ